VTFRNNTSSLTFNSLSRLAAIVAIARDSDEARVWLKALGTSRQPLAALWMEDRPELVKEIRFPPRTPTLETGDKVLYYASGWQRIFAAGQLTTNPKRVHAPGYEDYPWVARVRLHLLVPDLALAPDFRRADIRSTSVRSKSHIRLTESQYRKGVAELARAASLRGERYAAQLD
jgi:hypothetical protein